MDDSQVSTPHEASHSPTEPFPVTPEMENFTEVQGSAPRDLGISASTANQNLGKDPPKVFEITPYPSIAEIRNAIPKEGISVDDLVLKFAHRLDETNTALFFKLLLASSVFETKIWLKTRSDKPTSAEIDEIINKATTPRDPLPVLTENRERKIVSKLLESFKITSSEPSERARQASKILPRSLYRVFYENSATLCCYVNTHTHGKCRENRGLRLQPGNAFQPVGTFNAAKDLTTQRIERHLIWNMKREPSSYISAFNSLKRAENRAHFHYHRSKRIGERTSIARISTGGLVAATVRGQIEVTVKIFKKYKDAGLVVKELESEETTTIDAEIPVWIRDEAIPKEGAAITMEQFNESGADMWLSVMELRHSDLKTSFTKGHNYEWLCCGPIRESRIMKVMPFDGEKVHQFREDKPVKSLDSSHPWVWDWDLKMWRLESEQPIGMTTPSSAKRRNADDDIREHSDKRRKIVEDQPDQTSRQSKDTRVCCPNCDHQFCVSQQKIQREGSRLVCALDLAY